MERRALHVSSWNTRRWASFEPFPIHRSFTRPQPLSFKNYYKWPMVKLGSLREIHDGYMKNIMKSRNSTNLTRSLFIICYIYICHFSSKTLKMPYLEILPNQTPFYCVSNLQKVLWNLRIFSDHINEEEYGGMMFGQGPHNHPETLDAKSNMVVGIERPP